MKKIETFLEEIKQYEPLLREIMENVFYEVYNERKMKSGDRAFYSARAAAYAKVAKMFSMKRNK